MILAVHREEVIILGVFSKIPADGLRDSWVLVEDSNPNFSQIGLKKTSLIRADKIATVSKSVFKQKLGSLSDELLAQVRKAVQVSLRLNN